MHDRVVALVRSVAHRQRQARRSSQALWLWLAAASGLALLAFGSFGAAQRPSVVSVWFASLAVLSWIYRPRPITRADETEAARAIEAMFPALNQRLIALLEQQPDPQTGRFNVLQKQLALEVVTHAETSDWLQVVSRRQLLMRRLGLVTMCSVLLAISLMNWPSGMPSVGRPADAIAKSAPVEAAPVTTIDVEPGDTDVEKGSHVLILARFTGPLPSQVQLSSHKVAAGSAVETLPLSKSLDDPVFGLRLPQVDASFVYAVRFDQQVSREFRVEVFELPRVERIDAKVEFPSYTQLAPELIEDTWQVSAVEGSIATLQCRLNKPLKSGKLVGPESLSFELQPAANSGPTTYVAKVPVTKSMKLKFELRDDRDRQNRELGEFRIIALPNKPPEIAINFPAKDQRVSPIEEIALGATAWDDFGLNEQGVVVAVADREPLTISLANAGAAKQKQQLEHVIALEALRAEPDQLVSYYFYADDFASDGRPRRTLSDMFFAEVRHFEEIFRQGQQQPNGGQKQQPQQQQGNQQTQQIQQLAEQQKQVLNATWKLLRRESGATVSNRFVSDVKTIVEAQDQLIGAFEKLAEALTDPKSKQYGAAVLKSMQAASDALHEAEKAQKKDLLTSALTNERAAYEGLLKLRAREFQVVQSQSGGGQGGGAASPSQEQLSQLELKQQENRYEAERRAGEQTERAAEQREQLQVLNRLRELAQRQSDANQKIKDLERELKEAKAEAEREELKRQLKRLRDEQRDLLNDIDELKNRMDRPENQQRMAESRQQLEETRSKVRQTSDALEEGKLSQALSSGTRAERELEQLRDDFRQKAAGQFGEQMRQLRHEARDIAQKQDDLAKQLTQPAPAPNKSLRATDNRQQLADEFRKQREKLEAVLDDAKKVIEQAETSEPVLAKDLYETVRRTWADKPNEALEVTRELLRRGMPEQAQQTEKIANQGLDRLQEGIERASSLVLGDEAEALKQAREQVRNLSKAVSEELAQNDPRAAEKGGKGANEGDPEQPGDGKESSNQSGDPSQPGQNKPGQSGREGDQPANDGKGPSKSDAAQGQSQQGAAAGKGNGPGKPSPDGKPNGQQPKDGQPSGQPGQGSPMNSPDGKGSPSGQPGQSPAGGEGSGGAPGTNSEGRTARRPGGLRPATGNQQGSGGNDSNNPQSGSQSPSGRGNGPGAMEAPLGGRGFNEWTDRLRDVEETVSEPGLRTEIARIREAARSLRAEAKRHSKEPEWDLVRTKILEPLTEVEKRLAEEIARQQSPDSLVPLDRDPVPERYSDLVRKYYERLGTGK